MRRVTARAVPRSVLAGWGWVLAVAGTSLVTHGGDPAVWATLLVPCLVASYRAAGGWPFTVPALGTILAVGLAAAGRGPWDRAAIAALLGMVPLAGWAGARASRHRQAAWVAQGQAADARRRERTQHQQTLRDDQAALETSVGPLESLYDLTKSLLATLDRAEAIRHLAEVLLRTFPSAVCSLAFLRRDESQVGIGQILQIRRDGASEATPTPADEWVLARLLERPAIWSAWPMVGVGRVPDRQIPDDLRTATAFPLVADQALQGWVLARQLAPEAVDRCGILVSQFALAAQRIRLYERVQELAIRDGLTGLYVRRHFMLRVNDEVARAVRHELPLAFLMLDLDHFKLINDTYGHLVGDMVLRQLAALLRTQVRDVDLLGRYGGEEFAIAMPDTALAPARLAAERVRQAVMRTPFQAYDERLAITVSIGVAVISPEVTDAAGLVGRADGALYAAKTAGRNRTSVANG